ncbi:hypothetical protein [Peribacillus frigoritolerans]|uniref:hypothetical protein n=1 Tax=Peribacillus frigoritolerans TaxID=450367 RepID=UPI002E24A240|nr:hypothetical protein [Peribacillus frigoritolerans]
MEDYFYEGDCGYLKTANGEVPVVIGEETSDELKISSLENPGGLYNATKNRLVH